MNSTSPLRLASLLAEPLHENSFRPMDKHRHRHLRHNPVHQHDQHNRVVVAGLHCLIRRRDYVPLVQNLGLRRDLQQVLFGAVCEESGGH